MTTGAPYNPRKYRTVNPVSRLLIERFLRRICSRVEAIRPARIFDLGCGEGMVPRRLGDRLRYMDYVGIDSSPEALDLARRARPDLTFVQGDLHQVELDITGQDLVLCLEVLEHLNDPARALERISGFPQKAALFSVPWEPYFQLGNLLCGKNLRLLGNDPGHVQRFGRRSFSALLARHYPRHALQPVFPWIVALALPWNME
jgi:SAM-dependent methyltransferase